MQTFDIARHLLDAERERIARHAIVQHHTGDATQTDCTGCQRATAARAELDALDDLAARTRTRARFADVFDLDDFDPRAVQRAGY